MFFFLNVKARASSVCWPIFRATTTFPQFSILFYLPYLVSGDQVLVDFMQLAVPLLHAPPYKYNLDFKAKHINNQCHCAQEETLPSLTEFNKKRFLKPL